MRRVCLLIIPALFSMLLSGCGGGGETGSSGPPALEYTGSTEAAVLNDSNSEVIVTSAYTQGDVSDTFSVIAAARNQQSEPIHGSRSVVVTQALKKIGDKIEVFSPNNGMARAARTTSGTMEGDCEESPGSASYTLVYDDQTGEFSGQITFNAYCSEGVVLSGDTTMSGKLDEQTSFSFDRLTCTYCGDSFTMQGSVRCTREGTSQYSTSAEFYFKDSRSPKVTWLKDFSMLISEGDNYLDLSDVSGRFHHPDYGYVDISMPVASRIYNGDDWPSQGVFLAKGKVGAGGGNCEAKLVALSATQYQIEVDEDGDGEFEYNSGPLYWDDL